MSKKSGLLIVLMLMMSLIFPSVSGDGGIIGPPQIYIYERAQNAIVAWNGSEEVLILSIDIDSSEATKVLRVIPLPSNPINISQGSFDSFTKLQEIVNEKLQEAWNHSFLESGGYNDGKGVPSSNVEITFQDTIGAHNITIFHIIDGTNFSDYATDFAVQAGLNDITFSSEFQNMVEEYLEDDISFFVFDIIDTSEDEHSIDPIVYRFKTDFLFYPLKITAASDVGETYAEVNVFCITKNRIKNEIFSDLSFYSNINYYSYYSDYFDDINLSEDELLEISPDIYDIFKGDPILMSHEYFGQYSNIDGDIVVYEEDFAYPDADIIIDDTIFVERGAKTIVNLTAKNMGNTELRIRLYMIGGIDWFEHSWYSIAPSGYITVDEGNETSYQILFDIPSNIPLGDYSIAFTLSSSNYGNVEQKNVTMTIYDKTERESELSQDIKDLQSEINNLLLIMVFCIILFIVIIIFLIVKKK